MTVPGDLNREWATLLFYRGECQLYCHRPLTGFEKHLDTLQDLGVDVVALSLDPEEDAPAMAEEEELSFPVVYGLDCKSVAETVDLFYDEEDEFFHATNFLLRDGEIVQSPTPAVLSEEWNPT